MSSKRAITRRDRKKSCEGKKAHATETEAYASIRALHRARGYQGELIAYHCVYCGHWHFGHQAGAEVVRRIGAFA